MKARYVFIIHYKGQHYHTRPATLNKTIYVTKSLLKTLISCGALPPEEYDKQLSLCQSHVKAIRERKRAEQSSVKTNEDCNSRRRA